MLQTAQLVAFVATTRPEAARRFYAEVLGLRLQEDTPFALVFQSGDVTLRVQKAQQVRPAPYTALGWRVADIGAAMTDLAAKGVEFVRYDGMGQDARGVWQAPGGSRIAWFRDPDGHTLSLEEPPAP